MKDIAKAIAEEVDRLPDELAREVLDFVTYLEYKHGLRDTTLDELKAAQMPAMARVWDNPDDEVWNDL